MDQSTAAPVFADKAVVDNSTTAKTIINNAAPQPPPLDNWGRPFLRSMYSESDGTVSSTRFCMILVVVFCLGWVTALVTWHKSLPDLGSVGAFIALTCGTLYGINQGANVLNKRAANSFPPQQQ